MIYVRLLRSTVNPYIGLQPGNCVCHWSEWRDPVYSIIICMLASMWLYINNLTRSRCVPIHMIHFIIPDSTTPPLLSTKHTLQSLNASVTWISQSLDISGWPTNSLRSTSRLDTDRQKYYDAVCWLLRLMLFDDGPCHMPACRTMPFLHSCVLRATVK